MTIKKYLGAFIFLIMSLATLTSLTSQAATKDNAQVQKIIKRGVIHIGIKQDVPNFGYLDYKTGKFSGMEVDLGKKIAKALGVKVEFTPVTAQTRGALLDNNQLDAVIATFTINEERLKLYNFTTPYYVDAARFLVNKDSGLSSLKSLDGKKIGIAQGSNTKENLEIIAKKHHLHFEYVELGSYPELAIALRAHRVDAVSTDGSILSGFVSSNSKLLDYQFLPSEYGIATKLSNKGLNRYLNSLIVKWKKDGDLDKIYQKYHLKPSTLTTDQ